MKYVKIKSIKYIGKEPVYNMEVDKHHNFSINFGLIVHNCYDCLGYLLISSPNSNSKPLQEEKGVVEKFKEYKIKNMFSKKNKRKGVLN